MNKMLQMLTINSCDQRLKLNHTIEDALRSSVPKLTLDELFEKKDEIALEVQHQVAEEMTAYGYIIVKTLITKVSQMLKLSSLWTKLMLLNVKRVAAQELAEADKIKIVTAAEAEAEAEKDVFMELVLPNNVKPSLMV